MWNSYLVLETVSGVSQPFKGMAHVWLKDKFVIDRVKNSPKSLPCPTKPHLLSATTNATPVKITDPLPYAAMCSLPCAIANVQKKTVLEWDF